MIYLVITCISLTIFSHILSSYKPFFFNLERKRGNYGREFYNKYFPYIGYTKYYEEFATIYIFKVPLFMNDIRRGWYLFQIENDSSLAISFCNIGIIIKEY